MNTTELIKKNILDNIELLDLILDKVQTNKNTNIELLSQIKVDDKENKDVNELINEYRINLSMSFLLNEDLKRCSNVLNTLFRLSKTLEIDLEIEESTVKRLEHNLNVDKPYFVKDKLELVPLEINLYENIKLGLKNSGNQLNESILNNLRSKDE